MGEFYPGMKLSPVNLSLSLGIKIEAIMKAILSLQQKA